ncbi:MAG: methionyl-tRNA formyltransferase [Limisphaerales bacterium]
MPAPVRVVYFGTAPLARASLAALIDAPAVAQVAAVVTQPDKPVGRELRVQPSPVKALALERGLPVLQPARARDATFLDELRALAPDLIVVAAYGQILPPAVLDLPRHGCLNVHASLLPRWRGAAPIQWAILAGDAETGVTLMRMDAGLDTGPMLAAARTPLRPDDTGRTLHDRLAELGGALLVRTLPGWLSGTVPAVPQPAAGTTYARKVTKADGAMDWRRPAVELERQIRAFDPWPGSWTRLAGTAAGGLIKLWRAEAIPAASAEAPGTVLAAGPAGPVVRCGEGGLRLLELQREGGRRLPARAFLAGNPLPPGALLAGGEVVT